MNRQLRICADIRAQAQPEFMQPCGREDPPVPQIASGR
eukprot:CAMPEP_0204566170 /NCGR_PEP_ID=MMETSP0661-20131031/35901_1 /ASSEMBLY_ACC=CAM_ASM_000606 /TAXON_ID=109239 /ORGANISM="Alexandrium margalefi, Strain AMGDE01CS-322" /LENGTH=37 /DNA_ID= /DNA_START= /DNA_END= /DNA_ORIENTATION=